MAFIKIDWSKPWCGAPDGYVMASEVPSGQQRLYRDPAREPGQDEETVQGV